MDGFDYVVVGAGSAGAALAARLSERSLTRVLLLEAGSDYRSAETPEAIRSPNFFEVFETAAYHWPNMQARLTDARPPEPYPRGRGVGGSSAINAQGAMRGLPADFDGWRDAGCRGWGWEGVLPDFIALESDLDFGDRPYHGRSGPVPIQRQPEAEWGPVSRAFAEVATDLGHPWHDDLNAPDHTGVSPLPWNVDARGRVSSNDAYLEPARGRSNLEVRGLTQVDRIRFSHDRAVGVWLETAGQLGFVEAGEVILAAGAIHSPAILLRSGVGPAELLAALDIDQVLELPGVGLNLHDHPIVVLPVELEQHLRPATPRIPIDGCVLRWQVEAPADAIICPLDILRVDTRYAGLMVALLQPDSRGRVTIPSPDLHDQPQVEFQMLGEARDRERLRAAVRHALQALNHAELRAVGRSQQRLDELHDGELDAWLLASCAAFSHAAGSCRMGAATDPMSVVDPDCRVIGAGDLRVADASVIPALPRSLPHLAVTMIAEHLARCIAAEF